MGSGLTKLLKSQKPRSKPKAKPAEPDPLQGVLIKDPANFALLVNRYQKLLFKYVYSIFRDYHLAQDLSQEIFIKIYGSLAGYNARYPFSTWLLRVAHNYCIDHLRKKKLQLVSLEAKVGDQMVSNSILASLPAASREYEKNRERDVIKEAIFALDSDYRSVIFLRYLEGIKLEEISYILGDPSRNSEIEDQPGSAAPPAQAPGGATALKDAPVGRADWIATLREPME